MDETEKNGKKLAVDPSPCWVRGKEMFLVSLMEAKRPPSKVEIEEFMNDNAHLDGAVDNCKTLQNRAEGLYNKTAGGKFVRKLLSTLTIIKQVADPFLEFAPESVSLAWFAIASLIQIGAADIENCEIIFGACNNIAAILLTCRLYERRYQESPSEDVNSGVGSVEVEQKIIQSIPEIIASILDFSWHVRLTFKKNKFVRALKETFSPKLKEKIAVIEAGYAHIREIANDAFQERIMDMMEGLFAPEYTRSRILLIVTFERVAILSRNLDLKQDREELRTIFFPALDDIRSKLNDISEITASLEISKLREDFQLKRAQLRPSSTHLQQFQATFDPVSRHSDSICQWLFCDPHYKTWELNDNLQKGESSSNEISGSQISTDPSQHAVPNMFFLQARPGFGKSVAVASVIRRLSRDPDSIVCYFFFKQGDDTTQSSLCALTSLATQLFDDRHAKTKEELLKLTATLDQINTSASDPGKEGVTANSLLTSEMLRETIRGFRKAFTRNIYLLVDAIDECSDHEAEGLVPYLTELAESGFFKVMISSRDNRELETFFRDSDDRAEEGQGQKEAEGLESLVDKPPGCVLARRAVILNITEERSSTDMEMFLGSALERILVHRSVRSQSAREKETARMIESIKEKANGMFTYAAMVIANLEQPSKMTLVQKLKNLPKGMDALYRQKLDNLTIEEKKLVTEALRIVVFGCGNITTIEIAEHFKGTYNASTDSELDPLAAEDQRESGVEGEGSPSQTTDETSEAEYDAMSDPEIVETVYHLTKCGRDFFKFSNNQRDIDVIHKTVRDWVRSEAEKLSKWHETRQNFIPRITVDEKGGASMTVPIPPVGLIRGGDDLVELQSERDSHLDITIALLTSLSSSKFVNRYLEYSSSGDTEPTKELGLGNTSVDGTPTETTIKSSPGFSLAAYEKPKKNFRYEVRHLVEHLRQLEKIWPKEDRQGAKWILFWDLFRKFICQERFGPWASQWIQYNGNFSAEWSRTASISWKPIHLASEEGLTMVMEFLLIDEKANPNDPSHEGIPPIIMSSKYPAIVKLLVESTADVAMRYGEGDDEESILLGLAFQAIMEKNKPNYSKFVETCQIVANNYPDSGPDSALDDCLGFAALWDALEIFNILIARPSINIHVLAEDGSTLLHQVNSHIDADCPLEIPRAMNKALLDAGADPNAQDDASAAPLTSAVQFQDKDSVELLLQHGADVNDDDINGISALHIAASPGHSGSRSRGAETAESIVRLLLMYDADLDKTDKDGYSALFLAAGSGFEKVFVLLAREHEKKHGDDPSFLLGKFGKSEETYLHAAASNDIDGLAITKYLIRRLTPEQLQGILHDTDSYGETALHRAATAGNSDVIRVLLELGADITARSNKKTILDRAFTHWTASKSSVKSLSKTQVRLQNNLKETLLFLLKSAPQLAAEGKTNLCQAIHIYDEELISELVKCGDDIERVDRYGWTPFEHAYACRRLDTIRRLPGFSAWQDSNRKPCETKVPNRMRVKLKPNIFVLSDDGLCFETTAELIKSSKSDKSCLQIQANYPAAAHLPMFYWEVSMLELTEDDFYIGFMGNYTENMYPPGDSSADGTTFGFRAGGEIYPSKDGGFDFYDPGESWVTRQGYIKYRGGDTIGCGYSMEAGRIFYTLNGKFLGIAFENVRGRLHPTIGATVECKGKVNFGNEPFMFEI
ncbi:hypothetical protein TWF694_011431 [Orbilia ellipsospora]|uniref:B30.2/SPRY domain-containing protein n=1 Tax=Orbilia ellipsospora TaxID=2528407 RepID=A0AAV9X598_9PEZI